MKPLHELGVVEALSLLRAGTITSEALTAALLDRIAARDPALGAYEHVAPPLALAEARAADARGRPGPLAGLPIAVKDVIDVAGLPCERGTSIDRGRLPAADATCVARLRAAGAVVIGKTVTAEYAFYRPGKTRNPLDPSRTPGGSSSGSAAAVAAGLAPAALGTQTAGSVIRPASFCGVVGMKPTFGAVPLDGVSPFSASLDTLGLFVRAPGDLRPLLEALEVSLGPPPGERPPRLALCRTVQWSLAEAATRRIVEEAAAALARAGAELVEVESAALDPLPGAQRTIMAAEAVRAFRGIRAAHEAELSPVLRAFLDEGAAVTPEREAAAREAAARGRAALPGLLGRADALLTAAAPGEAPVGLESTGDPAMNRIWTLLGAPCLSLPAGHGPAGLPVGLQLVAAPGADGQLLRAAEWSGRVLAAREPVSRPRGAAPAGARCDGPTTRGRGR